MCLSKTCSSTDNFLLAIIFFWLVKFLLRKFDTSLKKKMKVIKTHKNINLMMKNKQICQPIKFGKFTSNWFWGVLYQPVHPESNINHFHQISVLDSALWFFIKTHRGVRKINFKIIFAPSLGSYTMSRPSLVNLYLTRGVLCQSVHLEWNVSHFR